MYMWMDWIIEPKVNAEVAECFGEAPAQSLACDQTADPNFCTEVPRGRTRRSGSASTTGRRRSPTAATGRRRLQGLQRLGPGLDRDQGVSERYASADGAADAASAPKRSVGRRLADLFHGRPRLQVGALLAGPVGWLVSATSARWRCCCRRLLVGRRAQRRGRPGLQPRQLRNADRRTGLPRHRRAHGPDRGAGHRSPTRCSPSRSPSTWPRWRAAGARRSWSSRS